MADLKRRAKKRFLNKEKMPNDKVEGYQENLDTPGMPYRFQRALQGQGVIQRKEVGK